MANVGQASAGSRGRRPLAAVRPRGPVRAAVLPLATVSLYGFWWWWWDVGRSPLARRWRRCGRGWRRWGYGRAGWYTHAWIEGHPDPGRIHPQYQHIAEGDLVPDAPGGASTWTVAAAEEPRLLVHATARRLRSQRNVNPATPGKPTWYQVSWAFILRPAGPDSTRLIMHRKQLRGIKQRAQNAGRRSPIAKAVTIHER